MNARLFARMLTMQLPSLAQIREAQTIVYRHMPPTPQYTWRSSIAAKARPGSSMKTTRGGRIQAAWRLVYGPV